MLKYTVEYSCGHIGVVTLYGKNTEREKKLKWYSESAICPDCYKAEMQAEQEKAGLHVLVEATTDIDLHAEPLFNIRIFGDTTPIKENIKKAGFRWSEYGYEYVWNVSVPLNKVAETVQKAIKLGAEYADADTDYTASENYKIAQAKAAQWIKEHGKAPDVPPILKGKRWNGKIYGKDKVYLDGTETVLTAEQLTEIKGYITAKEKYLKGE